MNHKHLLPLLGVAVLASCSHKNYPPAEPVAETTHYAVTSDGEALTSLTKVTETEYRCDYPFGGNNGRNLFFVVSTRDGYSNSFSNIYRKEDPLGGSMNEKTSGRNHHTTPSYCPATNMVAFCGLPEGSTVSDIYMMNATSNGVLQQITNTPNDYELYPCLSHDGKKVVYEKRSLNVPERDTEIWIKNLQTNETTLIGLGRMPSFSPDDRSIAYVRYSSDGNSTSLCTINIDGTNQTYLTDAGMGMVWRPCFSPDGQRIVFQCRKQQKSDYDLYTIDRSGNGLTQITINRSYDGEPYWASDGNIYFTSDRGGRDGHYQIWRFKMGNNHNIPTTRAEGQGTAAQYHTVQNGETITQIAQRYNVTVRDIVSWNSLTTMTITPGMRLKVSAQ